MSQEFRDITIGLERETGYYSYETRIMTFGEIANPPTVDETAPIISNFVPPIGTEIGRTDPIQFDVTDDIELVSVYITARYEDGTSECVWDHDSFQARFLAGSSRVAITDGYRFVLRRAGGWLSTPIIIDIVAVDGGGNVTTETFE